MGALHIAVGYIALLALVALHRLTFGVARGGMSYTLAIHVHAVVVCRSLQQVLATPPRLGVI